MHRVCVRSTFLDVETCDRDAPRHRASSEPAAAVHPQQLTALEQTTVSNLNALLDGRAQLELPTQPPKEALAAKAAGLKTVLSTMSMSTVAPDDSDSESSMCKNQLATAAGPSLRRVLSSSSVSTMAWADVDSEEETTLSEASEPLASSQPLQSAYCEGGAGFCGRQSHRSETLVSHALRRPHQRNLEHHLVPKSLDFAEVSQASAEVPPTTMMLRNIPNRYTQRELIDELEDLGFKGSFDFLYAPTDFSTMGNVGYSFINFTTASWAERLRRELEGYTFRKHQKKTVQKVATVSVAHLQGLQANLQHYEKSALAARARSKGCGPVIMPSLFSVMTC